MQIKSIVGSVVFALSLCGTLYAQDPQQAPPPAAPPTIAQPAAPAAATPAAAPAKSALAEGSDVHLKFAQDLTSKTANDDDPVTLVLDEDLKVGDLLIAKAGAKAVGTITHAKRAGMMGKG